MTVVKANTSYLKSISKQFADGLFSTAPHFCFVPEQLYEESNEDLWFNFAQQEIPTQQSIYTEFITSQNCYFLYEKNQRHIVPALLENANYSEIETAMFYVEKADIIILILLLHGKLQIACSRKVETQEDKLYHVLNLLQQWQLMPKDITVYALGTTPETAQYLNQYVSLETI